jgi:hypothetical protein
MTNMLGNAHVRYGGNTFGLNTPGKPGGGSPGGGYFKCLLHSKGILIVAVAPLHENNSWWERVVRPESVEKSGKSLKLAENQKK